ncbi:putative uncharacterized protein DDB_G0282499 isoform X2 [Teleopsis dalmanni]|uniref:putative uncharacterized protein DDB_G0282499 isoform X2 n=1 Tax=Teleopsis dalmanni TaxID=139649 RepID=UPI0018CDA478|nr:putative uncharacterized protein DDB_G0282499 isoform X2 [Teleopsis dalmanni]
MTTSQVDLHTNTNPANAAVGEFSGGSIGNNGTIDEGVLNGVNVSNGNSKNANNKQNNNRFTNNGSAANIHPKISDTGKRKKLKSRNITVPSTGYSKDHLDAWLETCLKDASNTQLSSSSEFLDYNPTTATVTNIAASKNPSMSQQQQQQQQHQQQQQQQNITQMHTGAANMNNFNINSMHSQQQFAMRNSSSQPSMAYPSAFTSPFSHSFQRNVPNFNKQSNSFYNRYSMMFPNSSGFYPINDGAQDFASLPPIVNMLGNSSEHENNSTDVLDGSGSNPNISRGFRFSDPCLLNPSDNDSKVSGQNTPNRRNHNTTEIENNKFFAALMEQINLLHETNSKICRNLHETKGAYTPGMMTDVVREVKEAARVREDALLNRVKALVEERQWSLNESNLRVMRDIEDLKSQVQHLRAERKESNKRINHLETENKYMRQMLGTIFNNRNAPDIIYENETLRMRKSYAQAHNRRTQPLHLNYGTIHHQPASSLSVEEQDEPLHIHETPSTTSTTDIASVNTQRPQDMRNSFSSTDSGGGGGGGVGSAGTSLHNGSVGTNKGQALSPPNFALVTTPVEDTKRKKDKSKSTKSNNKETSSAQMHSNSTTSAAATQELQRELNVAVAARKEADDRIIALEKLVKNMRVNSIHNIDGSSNIANGDGSKMGVGLNTSNAGGTVSQPMKWQHTSPLNTNAFTQINNKHSSQAFANPTQSPTKVAVAGPITDL